MTAEELLQDYRRYSEICNPILSGKTVSPRYSAKTVPAIHEYPIQSKPVVLAAAVQSTVNQELHRLGYSRVAGSKWSKGNRVAWVVTSKEFGSRVRVTWKELWIDGHAVIFDYSAAGGPICIIPIKALFGAKFVREKRNTEAYRNSSYWWSQTFSRNHELTLLILGHKDRWDLLLVALAQGFS